jgi:hypothetical protein
VDNGYLSLFERNIRYGWAAEKPGCNKKIVELKPLAFSMYCIHYKAPVGRRLSFVIDDVHGLSSGDLEAEFDVGLPAIPGPITF